MKFFTRKNLFITLVSCLICSNISTAKPLEEVKSGTAKNVIYLIPDGMSQGGVTLARWVYNDGKKLNLDYITAGLMQTHNSNTIIADSAPAGTAMATGVKTEDKMIGVRPKSATLIYSEQVGINDQLMPVASVLEAAKLNGKATGIISTSEVQHATPADFTSHTTNRKQYTNIGEQQVYQNMDIVMGGGLGYLELDKSAEKNIGSKYRVDNENMIDVIKNKGYDIVTSREEMLASKSKKIWGGFAKEAMKRNLDKPLNEPSIAEMTKKAIEVLSQNKNGFFLMIEGSQVDWAAHANDTIGIISEIKAFDEAVGEALKFAKSRKDTVVIAATDHGNSGITIGNRETTKNYSTLPVETFVKYLRKANMTEEKAAQLVVDKKLSIPEAMKQLGITDISEEEIKEISTKTKIEDIQQEMANIVSKHSFIGYTTGGHTGEDVAFYVYDPTDKNTLTGTIDNHELALYAAKVLGLNMNEANKKLFVSDLDLKEQGFDINIDTTDAFNPELIVKAKEKTFIIPVNKNIIKNHNKEFNGITVYNGKHFYIPQAMVEYMKK